MLPTMFNGAPHATHPSRSAPPLAGWCHPPPPEGPSKRASAFTPEKAGPFEGPSP